MADKVLLVKEDVDADFLEINPRFKTNRLVRDVYKEYGDLKGCAVAWVLYYMLDPKSSLFKDPDDVKVEVIKEVVLEPRGVDEDVYDIVLMYKDRYEAENLTYVEKSIISHKENLLDIDQACRDIDISDELLEVGNKSRIVTRMEKLKDRTVLLEKSAKTLQVVYDLERKFADLKLDAAEDDVYGSSSLGFRE